jgi:phosphatidylinositol alpha-1,6-mannosyltransferase
VCGGTYSAGWLMTNSPARSALVNYIHGEELTMQVKPRLLMPWMRYWQRRCLKKADMNLSVSNYTAEMVSEVTKFSERSKVFSNFIDLKRFQITGKRRELRAKYGWSENLVLLTVARLERRKGIDQALRALALLKQQGKLQDSWKYVIGGKGAERNALIQLTEELGLAERVEFLGFVSDESLTGLYESADVFIQPNREINGDTEGFGIVFLEANACGLPVIGGKAGGTGDAIEHGRTGFRVDSESVDEVADAIFLLMGNAELRRKMSLQGIAWAANFDVEQAVLRFDSLMEEALQLHSLGGKARVSEQ